MLIFKLDRAAFHFVKIEETHLVMNDWFHFASWYSSFRFWTRAEFAIKKVLKICLCLDTERDKNSCSWSLRSQLIFLRSAGFDFSFWNYWIYCSKYQFYELNSFPLLFFLQISLFSSQKIWSQTISPILRWFYFKKV